MKLLTHQPFSIHDIGGGARILRRLFEGREKDVVSLRLRCSGPSVVPGPFVERSLPAFPVHRTWQRGLVRPFFGCLRNYIFRPYTMQRLRREARGLDFDVLHVVAHGGFNATFCSPSSRGGKPLWVSFHDHWVAGIDKPAEIEGLWRAADRRFVVSRELGDKYSRDFGSREWEILSDGVDASELFAPREHVGNTLNLYFGGMLHLDYHPLFQSMADALDLLAKRGWNPVVHLRGTEKPVFLQGRFFEVRALPATLSAGELGSDLRRADILYLPIGFSMPLFHLYSLSTKMVGYLAAPGAILYHGPLESAAARLLDNAEAAALTDSLEPDTLADAVLMAASRSQKLSENAKLLARERFELSEMRQRFWSSCP